MPPALRSRFLHLKAMLLERYNAPDALEHFLESYEHDLMRGDEAGVAISLHAIARIYIDEEEYGLARERIREAMPLANKCGLDESVASLAYLWAEIDLAQGKKTSAATWLITARNKFAEDKDEGGLARDKTTRQTPSPSSNNVETPYALVSWCRWPRKMLLSPHVVRQSESAGLRQFFP